MLLVPFFHFTFYSHFSSQGCWDFFENFFGNLTLFNTFFFKKRSLWSQFFNKSSYLFREMLSKKKRKKRAEKPFFCSFLLVFRHFFAFFGQFFKFEKVRFRWEPFLEPFFRKKGIFGCFLQKIAILTISVFLTIFPLKTK